MYLSDMTEEQRREYWAEVKRGERTVPCRVRARNGHEGGGFPCAACTQDFIEMMTFKPDIGPWIVSADGRSLQSDDFTHDVTLKISGDFFDDELRKQYAQHLADILNAAPGVRPLNWLGEL